MSGAQGERQTMKWVLAVVLLSMLAVCGFADDKKDEPKPAQSIVGLRPQIETILKDTHTPGVSVELARWLGATAPVIGFGVETVGTDAGAAHSFEPAFPCHQFLLGAGKYGLTQLANLSRLPPTGAVLVAAPLPIVGGSGSPARVLAFVPS